MFQLTNLITQESHTLSEDGVRKWVSENLDLENALEVPFDCILETLWGNYITLDVISGHGILKNV